MFVNMHLLPADALPSKAEVEQLSSASQAAVQAASLTSLALEPPGVATGALRTWGTSHLLGSETSGVVYASHQVDAGLKSVVPSPS